MVKIAKLLITINGEPANILNTQSCIICGYYHYCYFSFLRKNIALEYTIIAPLTTVDPGPFL